MDFNPSPLQKLDLSAFGLENEVYIKRDDLIHPIVSGNKWRKLKRNISYFKSTDYEGIISMGGAYSSHILALWCSGSIVALGATDPDSISGRAHTF